MKKLLLLICCFFLFACAKPTATNSVVTKEFALELVETRINYIDIDNEQKKIFNTINSLPPKELALLKGYIKEILNQDPPITTSFAMRWLVYGLIYTIDDKLGTLKYTKIVTGTFDESLGSSIGISEFYFTTDSGEKLLVLESVATIYPQQPDKVLFNKTQKLRLYINEYPNYNETRNEVIKIEIITDNAPR